MLTNGLRAAGIRSSCRLRRPGTSNASCDERYSARSAGRRRNECSSGVAHRVRDILPHWKLERRLDLEAGRGRYAAALALRFPDRQM